MRCSQVRTALCSIDEQQQHVSRPPPSAGPPLIPLPHGVKPPPGPPPPRATASKPDTRLRLDLLGLDGGGREGPPPPVHCQHHVASTAFIDEAFTPKGGETPLDTPLGDGAIRHGGGGGGGGRKLSNSFTKTSFTKNSFTKLRKLGNLPSFRRYGLDELKKTLEHNLSQSLYSQRGAPPRGGTTATRKTEPPDLIRV